MSDKNKEVKSEKLDFGAVITKLEKSSDELRNIFCIHINKCLDYASYKFWNGFSCERCPFKESDSRAETESLTNNEYQITDQLKAHCDLPDINSY